MIVFASLFAAGILTLQGFEALPSITWIIIGIVLLLSCAWFRYWKLGFYVAGFLWAIGFAWQRNETVLSHALEGADIILTGTVSGLPQQDQYLARFNLIPDQPDLAKDLPEKIRLSWYHPDTTIKPGQHWQLSTRLKKAHGLFNPGGFDYELWLFNQNIGATGYVRKSPEPKQLDGADISMVVDRWRLRVAMQLADILKDSPNLGFIQALVLGDKHQVSTEQWQTLVRTGTVHLMAISGLHIGLVAGLVYFVVIRIWARFGLLSISPPDIAAIFAFLASAVYAALAGFSMVTIRALIMLLIAMVAIIWRRNAQPYAILAMALLVILILDPLAVLTPGFWLSFFAVVLILYVLSGRRVADSQWRALIKINLAISIGLIPFLLYFFQTISIISPVANFVSVPIVSFIIVPVALLATLLLPIHHGLATLLLQGLDACLVLFYQLLLFFSDLPFASIVAAKPDTGRILLALIGVLVMLMPRAIPGRLLGLLLIAPIFANQPVSLPEAAVRLTLLDIGQGLSVIVETQEHVLVYDAGARLGDKVDMGRNVVLPFLYTQGHFQVDRLLISHADNDHSGGAMAILDNIKVNKLLTSAPELFLDYPVSQCIFGQSWVWDQVKFEILAPPPQTFSSENNNSCVLKITTAFGSFLLPGDIELEAEQWLLKQSSEQLKANVLIAPHHGSKTSSSVAFLQQVDPGYVLISSGYRNRFHHPNEQVTNRYQSQGIQWMNTANQGAIEVLMDMQGIKLKSYRANNKHYWNRSVQPLSKLAMP